MEKKCGSRRQDFFYRSPLQYYYEIYHEIDVLIMVTLNHYPTFCSFFRCGFASSMCPSDNDGKIFYSTNHNDFIFYQTCGCKAPTLAFLLTNENKFNIKAYSGCEFKLVEKHGFFQLSLLVDNEDVRKRIYKIVALLSVIKSLMRGYIMLSEKQKIYNYESFDRDHIEQMKEIAFI